MSDSNEEHILETYFNAEQTKELNKWMKDRVQLVIDLQDQGEIPCASRMPRCNIERRDIPMILPRSYSEAGRIMAFVRKKCNLTKRQLVSIENFCTATGLAQHEVQRALDMCPMLHYWKDNPDKKK
jgi:hypothetical protein